MRKFDIKAKEFQLDQYWSSLSPVVASFDNAENTLINPDLDSGSTGFTPSNGTIINFITNSSGNNVFRIRPAGVAVAIRSTAVQSTQQFEEWYFECKVRATVPVTTAGFLIITAEVFNDGANAASANVNSSAVAASALTQEWVTISGIYSVPTVRNGIRFRLFLDGTVTDGEIEVDNFVMRRKSGASITSQMGDNPVNIAFKNSPLLNNRNITSDSSTSIRLDGNIGNVNLPEFSDFAISMIVYPELADMWILRFPTGIQSDEYSDTYIDTYGNPASYAYAGVKVNTDSTISLLWPVGNSVIEQKIIFTEQVSYLALTKANGNVTLQVNYDQVSQESDEMSFTGFNMGIGFGSVLVDKIAFTTKGTLPTARNYFDIFRLQRLDNVPRPTGNTSFTYLSDVTQPTMVTLKREDFVSEDGYLYAWYQSPNDTEILSIDKRAGFDIEVSIDEGVTWVALPPKVNLDSHFDQVLFRHQTESYQDYFIDIRATSDTHIALQYFDTTVTGPLHLPAYVGGGYYDVSYADSANTTFRLTPQENITGIRTIEMLGSSDEVRPVIAGATNYVSYVNGAPKPLTSMKHGQIYHVVVVFDALMPSVDIQPYEISGIGASEVPFTESDAYYVYNMFAGNTFVSTLETINSVKDGVSPISDQAEAAGALSLQWNS